jgi:purine-binding chemotaxis protein CheW
VLPKNPHRRNESMKRSTDPHEINVAERTLISRARKLAEAPMQTAEGASVDVLVFRLREEHYAIEAPRLRLVHRGTSLTPVPCTPPFVAGMLNVRGEVVTVLDLAVTLGLPGTSQTDATMPILLADHAKATVGLLVDEVLGLVRIALDKLDKPLSANDFALGIAEANIVVLDLDRLLSTGRFDVLEEVD